VAGTAGSMLRLRALLVVATHVLKGHALCTVGPSNGDGYDTRFAASAPAIRRRPSRSRFFT
jgi:hypothetical protein